MREFSKNPLNAHKEQNVNFNCSNILKKILSKYKRNAQTIILSKFILTPNHNGYKLSVVPTFPDL